MTYLIIALIGLGICIAFIFLILKKMFLIIKGTASGFKSTKSRETQEADAILMPYVKDGKIPSWAYDDVVAKLKRYCEKTELLTFEGYIDKIKPEVVQLPSQFKMKIPTPPATLTEVCIIRFRDFDLDTYRHTHQLSPFEQETLDYLCKMWFFSDLTCFTLQDGEDRVHGCLEGFVDAGNPDSKDRYHEANVKLYEKYL